MHWYLVFCIWYNRRFCHKKCPKNGLYCGDPVLIRELVFVYCGLVHWTFSLPSLLRGWSDLAGLMLCVTYSALGVGSPIYNRVYFFNVRMEAFASVVYTTWPRLCHLLRVLVIRLLADCVCMHFFVLSRFICSWHASVCHIHLCTISTKKSSEKTFTQTVKQCCLLAKIWWCNVLQYMAVLKVKLCTFFFLSLISWRLSVSHISMIHTHFFS